MLPTNGLVNPMLTDLYQLTMAYAYWNNDREDEQAVFEVFFRKNPFGGEFTVFAGLEEVLRHVENFRFTDEHLAYLRQVMPGIDDGFLIWLRDLDCSEVKIFAVPEGTIVFPRQPLIRVEGPLGIAQLLETTILNLVNYASLVATNAARFRLAVGPDKILSEFGLRRAQGPDGGMSASRYSYIGGFDSTSNVLAGMIHSIPINGTHAHSFVQSFQSLDQVQVNKLPTDFIKKVLEIRDRLGFTNTNIAELAAFIAYADAFPHKFLALVDTYDTLGSGVPNFICVAIALKELGYTAIGIRLDSGDLAYLSKRAREMFKQAESQGLPEGLKIVASNDIDEETIYSLKNQGHEIDIFGIGTHLVTCRKQPALGCVYKLVEINGDPRIKLSEDPEKMTIPGKKDVFRLFGKDGRPILDLMVKDNQKDEWLHNGEKILCRHPYKEAKRAYVTPFWIQRLLFKVWDNNKRCSAAEDLLTIKEGVTKQMSLFREDHLRYLNPTPYKVSVSEELYEFMHKLWMKEAPIAELK